MSMMLFNYLQIVVQWNFAMQQLFSLLVSPALSAHHLYALLNQMNFKSFSFFHVYCLINAIIPITQCDNAIWLHCILGLCIHQSANYYFYFGCLLYFRMDFCFNIELNQAHYGFRIL